MLRKSFLFGGLAVALAFAVLAGCNKSEPASPPAADHTHGAGDHHGHAKMPNQLGSEKEKKVFFTPGGLYTAADIAANGNSVPSVKFNDLDVEHDDHPKPGEKVCPITKTKANPKLTWLVGGKTYEFCCTPCVQEFVVKAKEKPGEIKAPEEYRAK
jgi:YHS domain-containing protein